MGGRTPRNQQRGELRVDQFFLRLDEVLKPVQPPKCGILGIKCVDVTVFECSCSAAIVHRLLRVRDRSGHTLPLRLNGRGTPLETCRRGVGCLEVIT
jgi:hypothetical protein